MKELVDVKREEYRQYIDNHMANVWNSFINNKYLFIDTFGLITCAKAQSNIINHDKSKLEPEEFEPYRKNFYPVSDEEKENNKRSFQMAVQHHYEHNPHHWNHWVDSEGNVEEMDDIHIIEMICDWMAMGIQYGNTAKQYYEKEKHNIKLGPYTRAKVELFLSKIN